MVNPPVKYFKIKEHPLSESDFIRVQKILDKFPLEDVTVGDAGEINRCKVGRLMEDKKIPTILNENYRTKFLILFFKRK